MNKNEKKMVVKLIEISGGLVWLEANKNNHKQKLFKDILMGLLQDAVEVYDEAMAFFGEDEVRSWQE